MDPLIQPVVRSVARLPIPYTAQNEKSSIFSGKKRKRTGKLVKRGKIRNGLDVSPCMEYIKGTSKNWYSAAFRVRTNSNWQDFRWLPSGSHAQIFLHWSLGPYAENPSDRNFRDTLNPQKRHNKITIPFSGVPRSGPPHENRSITAS